MKKPNLIATAIFSGIIASASLVGAISGARVQPVAAAQNDASRSSADLALDAYDRTLFNHELVVVKQSPSSSADLVAQAYERTLFDRDTRLAGDSQASRSSADLAAGAFDRTLFGHETQSNAAVSRATSSADLAPEAFERTLFNHGAQVGGGA